MILDAQNLFSDAQAITSAAASDNYIDLKAARNLGVGKDLYIVAVVDVAFTDSSSDSTLAVTLETHEDTSFSSGTVTNAIFTFDALSAIGTTKIYRIAPDVCNEQYARLYYTPANGNLSTGSITAFVTTDVYAYTSYPDGVTFS